MGEAEAKKGVCVYFWQKRGATEAVSKEKEEAEEEAVINEMQGRGTLRGSGEGEVN